MNWFAIGGGAAVLIVGINVMLGRAPKIPRPLGIVLAAVGAYFVYMGSAA